MNIFERPPSSAWEPVPLADDPQHFVWVWFRPAATPQGLFVQVPDETFSARAGQRPLTARNLLQSVGLDPRQVAMWQIGGAAYDAQQGLNPALDYAIPSSGSGESPTIGIFLNGPPGGNVSYSAGLPSQASASVLLSQIETDWNASLLIEVQLGVARNQLNGMLLRTNSLNRDLSPDESRLADQQDKRDWQETRRWLRDIASRLSRLIKDHDMGMTSAAGRRTSFEAIYQQCVANRQPFEGIEQAQREFELYRKTLQTLLNNMNSAHGFALQDGERRAQQVLASIAAKVRVARSKR